MADISRLARSLEKYVWFTKKNAAAKSRQGRRRKTRKRHSILCRR